MSWTQTIITEKDELPQLLRLFVEVQEAKGLKFEWASWHGLQPDEIMWSFLGQDGYVEMISDLNQLSKETRELYASQMTDYNWKRDNGKEKLESI